MTEKCSNCKFYSEDSAQVKMFGDTLPGVCRVHPPVVVAGSKEGKTRLPSCRPDSWCGHWEQEA